MNKRESHGLERGYQDTDDKQIEKREGQSQIPECKIADMNKVIDRANGAWVVTNSNFTAQAYKIDQAKPLLYNK
ncbi:hypothetical protein [Paenibacillus sp. Mc5Re-14]|uniref:hypothetical protein n=1 Tax=Paenibacillus sp. Mc5Re-14 TaxID=1030529 RepID=UPI000A5217E4|nr:hypothetical protein [Paenibacillus sp. Mc5Re-14]